MIAALKFATDFGDLAVILPVSATLVAGLWLGGWRRGAVSSGSVIVALLALMLLLKLVFLSHLLPAHLLSAAGGGLRNPSGHTAAATAVGGCIAGLLAARRNHSLVITTMCAAAIAVLIGVSRVVLGEHSVADVLLAAPIGIAAAIAIRRAAGVPPPGFRPARPVLAALAVAVAMHGAQLKVEKIIENVATGKPWIVADTRNAAMRESFW